MVSALLSRCLILVLGTLFPAYRSYKAIKNKDVREHVKWMMYWIVFALFTTLETFSDIFLSWFPFYYEIKILFILWVLSPATRGSSLLYKKVVHPLLTSREKEIDELIEKTKQQGYTTFLQLFSSGFQYASNIFVNSALKSQSFLGNQLKKSLSMNDVYDEKKSLTTGNNESTNNQENGYFRKKHETINEEESEESEYETDGQRFRSLSTRAITVPYETQYGSLKSKPTRKASVQPNMKDFEIIDDEMIEPKKPITRRRAGSKQTLADTNSTYKSNEAAHFGTITRAKTQSKTKTSTSASSSSLPTQTIYDNDT